MKLFAVCDYYYYYFFFPFQLTLKSREESEGTGAANGRGNTAACGALRSSPPLAQHKALPNCSWRQEANATPGDDSTLMRHSHAASRGIPRSAATRFYVTCISGHVSA